MNRAQIVKAAYFMCLACGIPPSRRHVGEVIQKQLGRSFRPEFIAAQLKIIASGGNHLGTEQEPAEKPLPEPSTERESGLGGTTSGTTSEHEQEPATLRYGDKSIASPVGEARVEPTPEQPLLVAVPAPTPKPAKAPKQAKLGLDDDGKREVIAARQLIDRLWHHLERTGDKPRATTKTGWAQKQMRPAREMVRAGITQEQFEADLEQFRGARGYYPRMLGWLAEFMERRPRDNRPPRPQLEPGETCWWSEDGERWMVESPHDPPTRFELEAEHG